MGNKTKKCFHYTYMKHIYLQVVLLIRKMRQWSKFITVRLFPFTLKNISNEYFVTSTDLCELGSLANILGIHPRIFSRISKTRPKTIIGWGRKQSGNKAGAISALKKSELLLVEDGFLRSFDRMDETLSLVFDNQGIFYDANCPSQIEMYIAEPLTDIESVNAAEIIHKWKTLRVSKYNSAPEYLEELPKNFVLVLDQVFGDLSVSFGNADASSFQRMLHCALNENPEATVLVKVHPDIFTRDKKGYFDIDALRLIERVQIISENCHPVRLIENATTIYTVTSQVGFEGLIWGKKVRCFGSPFYAGWGLTDDDQPVSSRRKPTSLENLVYGALIKYSKYVDPERQTNGQIEKVFDHIALQRQFAFQFPCKIYALAFSPWKKRILRRFLFGSNLKFVKRASDIPIYATVAVWGNNTPKTISEAVKVLHLEDGFLRSVGLGADLVEPISWVIDDKGIYYDSRHPSRLELILQNNLFDPLLLKRAHNLQDLILSAGITKYNLEAKGWMRPSHHGSVILVPGQVESDASIRFGSPQIRTNIDLLCAVRSSNPDAYIVYKPHPDVVSGLRRLGDGEERAKEFCDEIALDADPATILVAVDEVHTMTSLIGFEALLRGVSVTCYGQPFYSSWGLTNDNCPVPRRSRKLSIEELIAGALILYPRYISRVSKRFTTPEVCIEELVKWRGLESSRLSLRLVILRIFLKLRAKLQTRN